MQEWQGFTKASFDLLRSYKRDPNQKYNKDIFDPLVRDGFNEIKDKIFPVIKAAAMPLLLTNHRCLSQHSNRQNKLLHHFWAAFYRDEARGKSEDFQLYFYMSTDAFKFGVYMGEQLGENIIGKTLQRISSNGDYFRSLINSVNFDRALEICIDDAYGFLKQKLTLDEVLMGNDAIKKGGFNLCFTFSPDETVNLGKSISQTILQGLLQLVPIYKFLVDFDSKSEPKTAAVKTQKKQYWIMALGENGKMVDWCHREGVIAIGWGEIGDLKKFEDKTALSDELNRVFPSVITEDQRNNVFSIHSFCHLMQVGDVVYIKAGRQKILGKVEVTGDYIFSPRDDGFSHIRKCNWLKYGLWEMPKEKSLPLPTLTGSWTYSTNLIDAIEAQLSANATDASLTTIPHYTIENATEEVFDDVASLRAILDLLIAKKNLILQGPPGVGKTFLAKRLAYALIGKADPSKVETVQFHESYSYEDFVEGIRPDGKGGFVRQNGIFRYVCDLARDSKGPIVLLIDEINRGNLSRIFGELMMLIERDKRGSQHAIRLTYSANEARFSVPENLYIIGTMNTADRSIAMVDYALRRRFCFVDIKCKISHPRFRDHLISIGASERLVLDIVGRVSQLNERIVSQNGLGAGFCIGQSYFCSPTVAADEQWYRNVVNFELAPLLREYWFDDESRANEEILNLMAGYE